MMSMRPVIRLATGLGVLSAGGVIVGFLALSDIAHGEPDLTLEWAALRGVALLVVAFHVTALWALRRAGRALD